MIFDNHNNNISASEIYKTMGRMRSLQLRCRNYVIISDKKSIELLHQAAGLLEIGFVRPTKEPLCLRSRKVARDMGCDSVVLDLVFTHSYMDIFLEILGAEDELVEQCRKIRLQQNERFSNLYDALTYINLSTPRNGDKVLTFGKLREEIESSGDDNSIDVLWFNKVRDDVEKLFKRPHLTFTELFDL